MKRKIKALALGGALVAGMLTTSNVKAISQLNYTLDVYKKYEVLTDEGTLTLPTSYHFDNGTEKGYDLDLTTLSNTIKNFAAEAPHIVQYDETTRQVKAKYGVQLKLTAPFDITLMSSNGLLESNYNSPANKERLVRIAEVTMLLNSKQNALKELQANLDSASSDKERTLWSTQIQNYKDDIERMKTLNLNDIPESEDGYGFFSAARSVTLSKADYNLDTWEHIGDDVGLSYYYYVILVRDLRLSQIKYSINGGEQVEVPKFDKDTKEYTVTLSPSTPKDATITTTSKSYSKENDLNLKIAYDSGISVEESSVTLNNGQGTGKIKVKFDATPYGDNGKYEKEYTIHYVTLDYEKGDVNKDGLINSTDAAIVLDFYKNGNAVEENFTLGDMNNDNILNSTDAAMILDIYINS